MIAARRLPRANGAPANDNSASARIYGFRAKGASVNNNTAPANNNIAFDMRYY